MLHKLWRCKVEAMWRYRSGERVRTERFMEYGFRMWVFHAASRYTPLNK